MKKIPESCGIDGVMMLKMIQTSEKNIHFVPIFIQNFQILYAKNRQIGTVFFSCRQSVTSCEQLVTSCGQSITACGQLITSCEQSVTACGHSVTFCEH